MISFFFLDSGPLTLTTLWENSADDKFDNMFSTYSKKQCLNEMSTPVF